MKFSLFFILITILSFNSIAQKFNQKNSEYAIDAKLSKMIQPNYLLKDASEANILIATKNLIPEIKSNNKIELKITNSNNSLKGKHYQLSQYINDVRIYRSEIKVNVDAQSKIKSILYNCFENYNATANFPSKSISDNYISKIIGLEKSTIENIYFPLENELTAAKLITITTSTDLSFEVILNNSGDVIYYQDLNTYHTTSQDSVVNAYVFFPDPLTSANQVYGAPYNDNGDADTSQLNNQRILKPLNLKFSNDTFYLENAFAKIMEFSAPTVAPIYSLSNTLNYTRSNSGFEDINALFHISNQQLHLQSMGFTNLVNYQIQVDTHGLNGADNSVFTSTTNPPRLTFGEGGVDDAEDADVVTHEYGHAISFSAAPNTNTGTQRKALDEAIGDIFACGYSKTISNNFWYNTFTWDGHNEFWAGRVTNSTKHYPDNLNGQIHSDGEIWASVIMEIENVIIRDTAETLLLESMFSWTTNMSMSQAADLYILADSALYNGAHYTTICTYFYNRGLVAQCLSYTGIDKLQKQNISLFPNPAENSITISGLNNQTFKYKIFDSTGKLVSENQTQNAYVSIGNLSSGIYNLIIINAKAEPINLRFVKL